MQGNSNIKKDPGSRCIQFSDFNFKLSVIQELMYLQRLVQPAFDLHDFVRSYQGRNIDIEKEGYGEIPEAVEYFKNLEIDNSLAEYVTSIGQDGGNSIYSNICPFWSGEDEKFDIKSYADVIHFPNLKRMEVFSPIDSILIEELRSKGIRITRI